MLTTALTKVTARRRARVALVGAVGAAALSLPLAGPASADASFDYSAKPGAVAVQIMADSNPEPSPVPDLTDVELTTTDGSIDSFGTSDSSAHLGNTNGLGQIPGLICLASPDFCNAIGGGIGMPFPPADPLDAHASYPSPASADAPVLNGKVVPISGGDPSSAQVALGQAHAEADLQHVLATVTGGKTSLVGQVTIGSSSASQIAHVVGGALVTHAESTVNDISIGGTLLHIGAVHAVSDVTTKLGTKPVDRSSLTVSGVTVLGQAATIDQDGVHLATSLPSQVQSALQSFLNTTMAAGGVTVRVAGASANDDDNGHESLVQGLIIGFKTSVQGLPAPNVAVPPQASAACAQVVGLLPGQLTSQIPVDVCSGVGLNPNGDYFGQIVLGQAGTLSQIQASGLGDITLPATPIPPGPVTTPTTPTAAPTTTALGQTGGTTTFTPPAGTQPLPVTGPQPNVAPPAATGGTRTVALDEGLGHGLHGRLLWLFPVLLLAVVGAIAGRLRAPHRLPGPRR